MALIRAEYATYIVKPGPDMIDQVENEWEESQLWNDDTKEG